MNKQEALDKIDELRKFVEQEDSKPDYSKWIGKWGFVSAEDSGCPDDGVLVKLKAYNSSNRNPFISWQGCYWPHFRPAKPEEIFPELFGDYVDWSKIDPRRSVEEWPDLNYIFIGKGGETFLSGFEPVRNDSCPSGWNTKVPLFDIPREAIIGPLPPWRDSLRHRPNTGT